MVGEGFPLIGFLGIGPQFDRGGTADEHQHEEKPSEGHSLNRNVRGLFRAGGGVKHQSDEGASYFSGNLGRKRVTFLDSCP